VHTGQPRQISPRDAAVSKHFYSVLDDNQERTQLVEEGLCEVESVAAPHVRRIGEPGFEVLGTTERIELAFFVALARTRTTAQRDLMRSMIEQSLLFMAREEAQAGKGFWTIAQRAGEVSSEELEQNRRTILRALERGEIGVDVPVNNLVHLALNSALATTPVIFLMDWTVVRTPANAEFIVGDTPVAMYDPQPIGPSGAFALLSSPSAETFLPLDPSYGLLIRANPDVYRFVYDNAERLRRVDDNTWMEVLEGRDVGWAEGEADVEIVRELNLRTYAHASRYIFGSQRAATMVRAEARRSGPRLGQLRPSPPQVHFLEEDASAPDVLRVTHTVTPTPRRRR